VEARLNQVLEELVSHHEDADVEMVRDAFRFASEIHQSHLRKGGGPYIVHPLSVAEMCANHWMDDVSVAAAFLHDCIEDADAERGLSTAVLSERFSPEVARIVHGMTKLRHEEVGSTDAARRETLNRLLSASAHEDIRTIVIKIFDRCDNIRTVDVHRPEKRDRIASETLRFYVPIAARLGFFGEAREMEDHVLRVLHPEVHQAVTRTLDKSDKALRPKISRIARELQTTLSRMGVRLTYRFYQKGVNTIRESLRAEGLPLERMDEGCNFNLCLVVDSVDACFRCLNLVHRKLVHLPMRVRDFINNPKINGYKSLHTICTGPEIPKIQVLIRTEEMELADRIGVISQLLDGGPEDVGWLHELVDSLNFAGTEQLMEETARVYFAEIDVLTPTGEPRKLPRGATALDFAYCIHTEIGNRADHAVIDGQPRHLRTTLRSGQTVEIVTATDAHPRAQWLGWVATNAAANAVRKALVAAERLAIAHEVERFFEYCRRELGVDIQMDSSLARAMMSHLHVASVGEIGREIYAGRLSYEHLVLALLALARSDVAGPRLVDVLAADGVLDRAAREEAVSLEDPVRLRSLLRDRLRGHLELRTPPASGIVIDGLRYAIPVHLAGCCRPEHGDEIVAYTSRSRGATIHRRNCRTIRHLMRLWPAQMAAASWGRLAASRTERFKLQAVDRKGLLLSIGGVLSGMKVGGQSIDLRVTKDGVVSGEVTLEISDLTSADEVLRRLKGISGMREVHIE